MSTVYGTNADLEAARTVTVAQLNALVTAMVTVSPKLASVYSTHLGDPALVFNSVSVGIPTVEMAFPAMKSSPAGAVINMLFHVELRVMTGNTNDYIDEIAVLQLCNSIVNWLEEHRSLGSGFVLWETQSVESGLKFDDTDTIGGRVKFTMRSTNAYVAA